MSKRRTSAVGSPMLVNLPQTGYTSTGEGGLAFYLLVPGGGRLACIVGGIEWPKQDVVVREWSEEEELLGEQEEGFWDRRRLLDAGLLIGSTGLSLSDEKGNYFQPTYDDLTPEGRALYDTLKKLYGEVEIVTLLDT